MPEATQPEIKTQVNQVTVYTDRAILTRQGKTSLKPGQDSILLLGLPDLLDEDSVRVIGGGTGSLTILDFKIQRKHYRDVPEERIQTLILEREALVKQKKALEDTVEVISSQEEFLQGIGLQSAETISHNLKRKSPSVDEWKSVLEFLGSEGQGLKQQLRDLNEQIEQFEKDIAVIEQSLKSVANAQKKVRKQILVDIEVGSEGEFVFEVSYMIRQASWRPMYDARVEAKTKEVQLRYYGAVTQRTGENWEGVKVLLSTARPHIGGNAPELSEWNLFFQPEIFGGGGAMPANVGASAPVPMPKKKGRKRESSIVLSEALADEEAFVEAPARPAQVVGGEGASVVFSPPGTSDVPGDGTTGKLLVMESPFGAEFQYLAVPKLAPHVYLSAKVKNSSEYPLLSGPISIFLDGNFVGKASITELVTTGEEFDLNLGVDEAIKVKRKLKRKFGDEKGLFTKSKVTQYEYQIELNNQHDRAESVTVQDQIPVSQEDDIKVKLESVQPAENPEKKTDELPAGVLEWKIDLNAREKATVEFGFSVSHARDAKISGL